MSSRILIASAGAVLLGACTNTVHSEAGFGATAMGDSTKYNAAVQIIDPVPVYDETDSQPGERGDKGAAAVRRYRTDTVKQTESQSTSSAATGVSSGPQ